MGVGNLFYSLYEKVFHSERYALRGEIEYDLSKLEKISNDPSERKRRDSTLRSLEKLLEKAKGSNILSEDLN